MTPWGVVATTVDEHTIELSWVNDPGLGHYTIVKEVIIPPQHGQHLVNASSTASSHLFTNLDSGVMYGFRVSHYYLQHGIEKASLLSESVANCTGKLFRTYSVETRGS